MASKSSRAMLLFALLATALSAAGWWFGAQLDPIWWLTWLAPLPLLWLATRVRARWATLAAFVAIAIGDLPYWQYTRIGLPVSIVLPMIAMPALILALAVLLFRRLTMQRQYLAAAFAFPVLIVAAYFINGLTSINGTWGDIGYTQMDALPIIQIAALTGVAGVSFLVMLGPAFAATLCNHAASRMARLRVLGIGGGLIALALIYGVWRLHAAPVKSGAPMQIGLISLQGPAPAPLNSAQGKQLQQRYVEAIGALSARGAQTVVLPEKVWSTPEPDIPAFAELARKTGVTVTTGVDYQPANQRERNDTLTFTPVPAKPIVYVKNHLLPFLMPRFEPGHDHTMLPGTRRIGMAICKDMDFPAMGRSYAARDAQLLLVPAWDFNIDGWLHSRMAIMRGVESGFAIARAARNGRLTLSDDRGRVLAEANSSRRDAQLLGTLYLRHTHTLYARWGNWFGWLDVAALLGLLGLTWIGRKSTNAMSNVSDADSPT
ncbi:MAG TPA: nitrilase-related carbon-nitrogen hydrolase [Rhodanobacteraceae bacterium]